MLLDSVADVSKMPASYSILYSKQQSFFCYLKQVPYLGLDLTNTECIARVTIETVKYCTTINRYNISILQFRLTIRHSMNNDIVYRSANT